MDIYSAWEAERERRCMEQYGLDDDEVAEPDEDFEYENYVDDKIMRGRAGCTRKKLKN